MTVASPASVKSIAIIGAGIIGLSSAWAFVQRGVRVTIFDAGDPSCAASWAAAGMLAPAFEAGNEPSAHPDLFEMSLASAKLWPDFANSLSAQSGRDLGVSFGQTLGVALDDAEADVLRGLLLALSGRGHKFETLHGGAAKTAEPALPDNVCMAAHLKTDGQVDNRAVMRALRDVLEQSDLAKFVQETAPLKHVSGGVQLAGYDAVLVSAGWRTGEVLVRQGDVDVRLDALEPSLRALVPVGGQMLSVLPKAGQTPKATLRDGNLYIVPKSDRVIIGATVEPDRVIHAPDAQSIAALKAAASRLCPGLSDAEIIEVWAGVRPGLPDHAPMIGRGVKTGVWIATGHYRNGILMAPLTARWIVSAILDKRCDRLMSNFLPDRFTAATA